MGRVLQARIDRAALQHNLRRVRELAPNSAVLAMVKANGYGHGLVATAQALQTAEALGVASIAEAIALRQAGIKNRVVAMQGFTTKAGLENILAYQLEPIIHQAEQIDLLEQFANKQLKVWLKINTGMNRLGFHPTKFASSVARLANCSNVQGVITHFSDADDLQSSKTKQQLACFNATLAQYATQYPASLANSAAILAWPATHSAWVRPGLMLYGVSPFADSYGQDFNLQPAMTLTAEIMAIQAVARGDTIGYTSRFSCPHDMLIGVITVGYADGYSSLIADNTPVLVGGVRTRVIGKVSMDMATIDLTNCNKPKIGDTVTLWGAGLPVEEVARHAKLLPYELLTSIGERVERIYTDNTSKCEVEK